MGVHFHVGPKRQWNAMFNWFIKRTAKAVAEIQKDEEEKKKLQDAYDLGQKAAQQFRADVDAFASSRFAILLRNYMKVFRERLDGIEKDAEAPPLILARIEHNIFMENVKKLKPQVEKEIWDAQAAWIKPFETIGVMDEMRRFVESKVDDLSTQMLETSLNELLSRVDYLKPLDSAWRDANPEKSVQFPPPTRRH